MHDRAEIAAEILGRKPGEPRERIQRNVLPIVTFDVFQRGLKLLGLAPVNGRRKRHARPVLSAGQHGEQLEKAADRLNRIAALRAAQAVKPPAGRLQNGPIGQRGVVFHPDAARNQRRKRLRAGLDPQQQRSGIENHAFVHAVGRLAAVNRPLADHNQIAFAGRKPRVVQIQLEPARNHAQKLTFDMPVHRHAIARMLFVHIVMRDGQIGRSVLNGLVAVKIVHGVSPV